MSDGGAGFQLPVINWFERPIKQAFESVFRDVNGAVESLDLLRKYHRRHFRAIEKNLSRIKVLGISQPIDLVDIYSPAHISTTIHRRLYRKEWLDEQGQVSPNAIHTALEHPDAVPAVSFIESSPRTAILGIPGSGKTTFLRYLALAYTNGKVFKQSGLKQSRFPFYVPLHHYSMALQERGVSILQYLSDELGARTDTYVGQFVSRILANGHGVVLLDAFDEIPSDYQSRVIDSIAILCRDYPSCRIVLSCRLADYPGAFESFQEGELTRLTSKAIARSVRAWFESEPRRAQELLRHIKGDEGIRSLTETPLLLSLICIQFRHDLALPKQKAELYKRCIEAFLREWDTSRGFRRDSQYANLSDERKERTFDYLAAHYLSQDAKYLFPESDLCEVIAEYLTRFGISKEEAPRVLREVERHHGILERFSAEFFMFSHPTFQDYFAARHFLSKRIELSIIRKHLDDPRWANVIEFIAALIEDSEEVMYYIMQQSILIGKKNYPAMAIRTHRLWLLYRCLTAGASLPPAVRRGLYNHLVSSQIEIARIYEEGGVIPIAALMEDGVRHAFLMYHKRDTLYRALQPLRLLANHILTVPDKEYARVAFEQVKEMTFPVDRRFRTSKIALALCLVVPLASVFPRDVDKFLESVESDHAPAWLLKLVAESRQQLRHHY